MWAKRTLRFSNGECRSRPARRSDDHPLCANRAFFLLAFLLVVFLSMYFISNIYQKWSASPIIIGLNAVATPISEFPFPAVTICNMNQARRSIVNGFSADSVEKALLQSLCRPQSDDEASSADAPDAQSLPPDSAGKWMVFRQFLLDVSAAGGGWGG